MQLSRYMNLVATAYSSSSATVEVDASGCEGVVFVAVPGTTLARTGTLVFQHGDSTSAFVAISTTHSFTSTGAVHDVLTVDWYKPTKRWLKATYSATADAENRILAFAYGQKESVTTFGASGVAHCTVPVVAGGIKRLVSPSSAT
jgi:hypothetical protein